MEQVSVVGLDLAKSVFQVHGVNARGEAVLRRKLSRGQLLKLFEKLPPCFVGMEACASAHHWARELVALGHEVTCGSFLQQRTFTASRLYGRFVPDPVRSPRLIGTSVRFQAIARRAAMTGIGAQIGCYGLSANQNRHCTFARRGSGLFGPKLSTNYSLLGLAYRLKSTVSVWFGPLVFPSISY